MRIHVLDTSAMYRYLTAGEGKEIVKELFKHAVENTTPVLMSAIQWGELYYTLVQRIGIGRTDQVLDEVLGKIPLRLVPVEPADAVRAGKLKAQYHIPYADAFAASLAGTQHVVVTADVKDFARIPKLRILKLPPARN
jgi:predicted nucleic acid-binding protein